MDFIKRIIGNAVTDAVKPPLDKQTAAIVACFNAYNDRLDSVERALMLTAETLAGLTEIVCELKGKLEAERDEADWWKDVRD